MIFSIFRVVLTISTRFQNLFITPERNTILISSHFPFPLHCLTPGHPLIYITSLDLPIQNILYIWNDTVCVLCIWLFSLSMYSRLIYIVACVGLHSFLWLNNTSLYTYTLILEQRRGQACPPSIQLKNPPITLSQLS